MSLKRTKIYRSFSSEDTKKFGEKLAGKITRGENAVVFALKGDLGAGKTTFVQGFFNGLGLKRRAPSPTFIIMRRHSLGRARKNFSDVFHVDAYRLKDAKNLAALDFHDVLSDPRNIVLIEWADRVKKIIPKNAVWLSFRHGKKRERKKHYDEINFYENTSSY